MTVTAAGFAASTGFVAAGVFALGASASFGDSAAFVTVAAAGFGASTGFVAAAGIGASADFVATGGTALGASAAFGGGTAAPFGTSAAGASATFGASAGLADCGAAAFGASTGVAAAVAGAALGASATFAAGFRASTGVAACGAMGFGASAGFSATPVEAFGGSGTGAAAGASTGFVAAGAFAAGSAATAAASDTAAPGFGGAGFAFASAFKAAVAGGRTAGVSGRAPASPVGVSGFGSVAAGAPTPPTIVLARDAAAGLGGGGGGATGRDGGGGGATGRDGAGAVLALFGAGTRGSVGPTSKILFALAGTVGFSDVDEGPDTGPVAGVAAGALGVAPNPLGDPARDGGEPSTGFGPAAGETWAAACPALAPASGTWAAACPALAAAGGTDAAGFPALGGGGFGAAGGRSSSSQPESKSVSSCVSSLMIFRSSVFSSPSSRKQPGLPSHRGGKTVLTLPPFPALKPLGDSIMHVTMVKKRLANGEMCRKCAQAEDLLKTRGLFARIDEVVWALENDPSSEGMRLAARFGVEGAPFFIVRDESGAEIVYESVLKIVKERLSEQAAATREPADLDVEEAARELANAHPERILRWGLERFGAGLGIAFSGAEDVALIHMASTIGLPHTVFSLDTGRLHPETYRFIDAVRNRYGIEIALVTPDPAALEPFVRTKGLFSFYEDGHEECCGIRKVGPLRRALAGLSAWATGQRRDQSPSTRSAISVIERDRTFSGTNGPLVKLNPLAAWTSAQTWQYIRENDVPFNALHERGFVSIGCEPCTRAILPGEHERAGRWWWEDSTKRECGLHIGNTKRPGR